MSRSYRAVAAGSAAVLGALALALACSDGSGPDNGSSAGSIGGRVTSADAGVPGAGVALTGDDAANRITAADGSYLFAGLAPGSYTLTLTLPDDFVLAAGESAVLAVDLAAGQDATVNWSATRADPELGTISGTVTAGGVGVQGATIALAGAASATTTTNAAGGYTFSSLTPGDYTVTVTLPPGYSLGGGEEAEKPAGVNAGATTTVNWTADADDTGVTVVTLAGTSFSPSQVTIEVGTKVRWVVNNGVHTVTPDAPGQPDVWTGTGLLNPGQQFEHTFTRPGTYDYHCMPHEALGMTGTVTVQ